MVEVFLISVKLQIPVDVEKLKSAISKNDIKGLPKICHHLISSISPLGNESETMKQIGRLQKILSENENEQEILAAANVLTGELEKMYDKLSNLKQV